MSKFLSWILHDTAKSRAMLEKDTKRQWSSKNSWIEFLVKKPMLLWLRGPTVVTAKMFANRQGSVSRLPNQNLPVLAACSGIATGRWGRHFPTPPLTIQKSRANKPPHFILLSSLVSTAWTCLNFPFKKAGERPETEYIPLASGLIVS